MAACECCGGASESGNPHDACKNEMDRRYHAGVCMRCGKNPGTPDWCDKCLARSTLFPLLGYPGAS